MSWKIKEKYRKILASETGAISKNPGGKLMVCLVYPNHYSVGMSNLGLQAIYAQLNSYNDLLCERAFLPDSMELQEYRKSAGRLLSLESQRPLADFDIVAFSVSFESDYLNIPAIFDLSAIQPFSADRDETSPLVIAGGAALTLNPEPVADFMDIVCIGEGEPILPFLIDLLRTETVLERQGLLEKAAQIPGIYVPALYDVSYDKSSGALFVPLRGAPKQVQRVWLKDLDQQTASSVLLTPDTEFSDMYLIELSRGCPHGCRFCAAGFIYLPYRQRSLELLMGEVAKGLQSRQKIGLVGAAISDYSRIGELSCHILECGGKVSVSSLRVDGLNEEMIEVLRKSGHRTIALAPEGGSQRLRDLIKKDVSTPQILAACDRLIGRGILNLKLYFIIGLPTESVSDLEEMVTLVRLIRERVIDAARGQKRLGEVILSINPFIPKPSTPFQWCGMEEIKSLERKVRYLQETLGSLSNVRLKAESLRDAYMQALLSRGDRRLSRLLLKMAELGTLKRAARELAIDTDYTVCRDIPRDEPLPWDIIESGCRERLLSEYRAAFGG
jgi:radical SAM superfamily enzyme YgiQ (UPF0313 family)